MRRLPGILFFSLCGAIIVGYTLFDRTGLKNTIARHNPEMVPDFILPLTDKPDALVSRNKLEGKPALVNIWASWCFSCQVEHSLLIRLAHQGIPVYGIDYKDSLNTSSYNATWWNSPYALSINDKKGELVKALNVTGIPETFLIDSKGRIRFHHVGSLDEHAWNNIILPRYQALAAEKKGEKVRQFPL